MMRKILTLAMLVLLSGTVGCRMCASCFDQWGPVLDDPILTNDGVHDRAGSAFGGVSTEVEVVPTPEAVPTLAPAEG